MSHFKIVFGLIFSINLVTSIFHAYGFGSECVVSSLLPNGLDEMEETEDGISFDKKWIEQPVDHFNQADNRTFKMWYLERTEFFKEGKPIILIPASTLTNKLIATGSMVDLAKEINGALFTVEHRYFGDSQPFDRLTAYNMRFLTTRQALADIANFLKFIKTSPKFSKSKVVVAGPWNSGRLATWMRLMYPDLVDAAYASSAYLLAKMDYFEWAEKISDNFKKYGSPGCWDRIAKFSSHCVKRFESEEDIEGLKKELHVCPECDMIDRMNQQTWYLDVWIGNLAGISTYAANTSDFTDFCDSNFTTTLGEEYLRPRWNSDEDCMCYSFKMDLNCIRVYGLQYYYQLCTEFGYARTTSSDNHPFTKFMTLDFYSSKCEALFGPDFNVKRMAKGVKETNALYGGLKPNVTKVVFVNGEFDPFNRLSVLEDLSPDAPAMNVTPTFTDWYSEKDTDSGHVKQVRARVKTLLKSWIGEGEYNMKP